MSEPLDDFVREVLLEHDGIDQRAEVPSPAGHAIEDLLGRGGMGAVYRARQQSLQREVAVKAMTSRARSPEMAERFRREALVLGMLEHPNIVPIHDLGMDENGQLFYSMKLVRGRTLAEILNDLRAGDAAVRRRHGLNSLLRVFQKACDALEFAHSRGVLHRDLKPENIMVGEFGEVLVMDWGLAKWMKEAGPPEAGGEHGEAGSRDLDGTLSETEPGLPFAGATLEGAVLGTPHYMSPEQAMGRTNELDERSDIFALGAILYAILTLRPPVEAATPREVLEKLRAGSLTPITSANSQRPQWRSEVAHLPGGRVPAALAAVAMKSLAVDKTRRYTTVRALNADIESYLGGFATSAQQAGALQQLMLLMLRHKTATASIVMLLLACVGFFLKIMASERRALKNEQAALDEKESTRHALARAQTALADAALRESNGTAARTALQAVPEDLRDTNWAYLMAHSDTSLATLRTGTTGAISAAAPHPKQAGVFALAGEDGSIALVNVRGGERLLGFRSGLTAARPGGFHLSVSPDGAELAVGNEQSGAIEFFGTADGAKRREWPTDPPGAIAFSPAGHQVLVTSAAQPGRRMLRLHDAETGAAMWTFDPHSDWIHAAFHPSGRSLVVASGASSVLLLDAGNGQVIRSLPDSPHYVHCLAVSPDGEIAAFGDEQAGVRGVRLADGAVTLNFRADAGTARQIHFTPDGRRLFTLSYLDKRSYNHLRIWDARSGYLLQSLLGCGENPITAVLHPRSGELVIVGGTTESWDLTQNGPAWEIPCSVNGPWAAFFGSDDTLLFLSPDGIPQLIRIGPGKTATALWQGQANALRPAASASADGRTAIFGTLEEGTDCVILRNDGAGVREIGRWAPSQPVRRLLRLSPDGSQVWTGGMICEAATGKPKPGFTLQAPGRLTEGQWVSPKRLIAVFEENQRSTLVLADAASGKTLRTSQSSSRILAVAVAPGGQTIAEAGSDKLVRLRDAESLALLREFRAHDAGITALAFHPNQPVLATTSDDLTLRLWKTDTGAMLEEMRGLEVAPVSLAWNPSGTRLASVGIDRTLRVWEPGTLRTFQTTVPPPERD